MGTALLELRGTSTRTIEDCRVAGEVGSSLQANVVLTLGAEDLALLASLGEDLKFVFIVSQVELVAGAEIGRVQPPARRIASAAGITATTSAMTRRIRAHLRPLHQQPARRGRNPHRGLDGTPPGSSAGRPSKVYARLRAGMACPGWGWHC